MILYLSMVHEFIASKGYKITKIEGKDQHFETLRVGTQQIDGPEILSLIRQDDTSVCFRCQGSFFILYGISLEEVCGLAVEACQFYDHWEKKLITGVWNNPDFQNLIDISEEVFQNPMLITNWQGKVLGYTKKYADAPLRDFWKDIVKNGMLPISCLRNLRASSYHQILTLENEATLLDFRELHYRCILGLVHVNHEIALHFQIIEYSKPLTDTDVKLAHTLLEVLQKAYRENQPESGETASCLFSQLLNKEAVDQKRLDWILASLGWNTPDINYYLVYFELMDGRGNAKSLVAQIGRYIPGCKMIYWNDYIIMLLSEPLLEKSKKEILYISQNLKLRCGVSLPFKDWNHLAVYLDQAKSALSYAPDGDLICLCLDYSWNCLLEHLKETTSSMQLIHPAIGILSAYDKENDTELARTLFYYLRCERNTTLAAEELYIHRNTLQYRIHRINSLIHVNLDNADVRSHLMVSYLLLQ